METIRIRDMQTHRRIHLSGDAAILRVPWEVSNVRGPCLVENGQVTYSDTMGEHIARTRPGRLGDCRPGDNILVQYAKSTQRDPRVWWLCEVEAVNGDEATGS